ncbi:hypothetical protein DP56_5011 [Burkholderia pseudomallei]|nr:hypothetical protein DP56_5011 [Burkholderia pseudomallei]KGW46676.1 hypothetical protein Y042_4355 [Burkholderia pseudomallei MSHR1357]
MHSSWKQDGRSRLISVFDDPEFTKKMHAFQLDI